jgi:phage shock protein A
MRLHEKLTEAKRRQDALLLRQESAEVRLKVREKAVIYNIDQAMSKFERYQEKIDRIEAQVEAFDITESQDLSVQIDQLAKNDSIEEELAAMKKAANA